MAVVDRGVFIKDAVVSRDSSVKTVAKIKQLKNDVNPMPITHAPIGTLAMAALDVLGVEPYKGDVQFVKYYIQVFKGLQENKSKDTFSK